MLAYNFEIIYVDQSGNPLYTNSKIASIHLYFHLIPSYSMRIESCPEKKDILCKRIFPPCQTEKAYSKNLSS